VVQGKLCEQNVGVHLTVSQTLGNETSHGSVPPDPDSCEIMRLFLRPAILITMSRNRVGESGRIQVVPATPDLFDEFETSSARTSAGVR
jgi:hypothetical protein